MDNVEIAKKAYADFSRGDIPALLAAMDDNVEWITGGPGLPMAGVRHGKPEVADFFRIVNEAWQFNSFEPKEFISSGDTLAVRGTYDLTSRKTGKRAAIDWVMVWKLKNGKLTHFQEYTDTLAAHNLLH